jgi:hypothetical protein
MPRGRRPQMPKVMCRTARAGLRITRAQRWRLLGLLVSGGDVWACVLELNAWRRARQDRPLVGYQELCRELAASGPGCFGELDAIGARSVLRRYSDAWFAAAKRRRDGDQRARFPRRPISPPATAAALRRPASRPVSRTAAPGAHLPGVSQARRDPRRRAHHRGARGSPGWHLPARQRCPAGTGVARQPARSLKPLPDFQARALA